MNRGRVQLILATGCAAAVSGLLGIKIGRLSLKKRLNQLSIPKKSEEIVQKLKTVIPNISTPDISVKSVILKPEEAIKYGIPKMHTMCVNGKDVSCYNHARRHPDWVFETLTKEDCEYNRDVSRQFCRFSADDRVPVIFRSENLHYLGSGFDRGHMVPASDRRSTMEAMESTFKLSNVCPQVGAGFNRDYWARFERMIRGWTKNFYQLHVYTGVLYIPKEVPVQAEGSGDDKAETTETTKRAHARAFMHYDIIGGVDGVSVPTHFYKIVVGVDKDNSKKISCFLMPNKRIDDSTPITDFEVPLSEIERFSGYKFFEELASDSSEPRLSSICDVPGRCVLGETMVEFLEKLKRSKQDETNKAEPTELKKTEEEAQPQSPAPSPLVVKIDEPQPAEVTRVSEVPAGESSVGRIGGEVKPQQETPQEEVPSEAIPISEAAQQPELSQTVPSEDQPDTPTPNPPMEEVPSAPENTNEEVIPNASQVAIDQSNMSFEGNTQPTQPCDEEATKTSESDTESGSRVYPAEDASTQTETPVTGAEVEVKPTSANEESQ